MDLERVFQSLHRLAAQAGSCVRVGELGPVPLEASYVRTSGEWQRALERFGFAAAPALRVLKDLACGGPAQIQFQDPSRLVDQERCGNRQLAGLVKHMAYQQIEGGHGTAAGEQDWIGQLMFQGISAYALALARLVDGNQHRHKSGTLQGLSMLGEIGQLGSARRAPSGPEVEEDPLAPVTFRRKGLAVQGLALQPRGGRRFG